MAEAVLDNPIWWSLLGCHARLAVRHGQAARYPAEITPLAALEQQTEAALADLEAIVPPGEIIGFPGLDTELKLGPAWKLARRLELLQMVCREPVAPGEGDFEELTPDDGDEMFELAQLTEPGPFTRRAGELGRFIGVRDAGRLIAIAGERFAPPEHIELSGVCTHPDARGRGLAERLVREITADIQRRGQTAVLHVAPKSPSGPRAIALYERMGYRARGSVPLSILERLNP